MQKRWCWAVWTSLSDPGLELIPTFGFRCPTLQLGAGKYDSFRGTTQMGVRCGPEIHLQATTPA
jgi:hypothetical protein